MGYNDNFTSSTAIGGSSSGTPRTLATVRAELERATNGRVEFYHDFDDSDIYEKWASKHTESVLPSSYYDYFYSGQDIKVSIEGTSELDEHMPVINLAYNVNQQKAPVYGLWSYTYDAVMRGQRLVAGNFTIATRHPGYMKSMLSEAAKSHASGRIGDGISASGYSASRSNRALTDDDENIERFWSKNIDPYLGQDNKNIFSVHPPFNFRIEFGIQGASVEGKGWTGGDSGFEEMYDDTVLMVDTNERLLAPGADTRTSCVILEAVELQDVQTAFAPDGSVVAETYQFFAREASTPPWTS